MNKVIQDLTRIKGLKHAFLNMEGHDSISTFPDHKSASLSNATQIIEQYYMAAQSIEKSYDEMIFPLQNGDNLIIFFFDQTSVVVLQTEEKINLPMAHMALKVITQKIKTGEYTHDIATLEPIRDKPTIPSVPDTPQAVKLKESAPKPSEEKEDNRPFTMYRGQKVYRDVPTQHENKAPAKKKLMYRGQEI